MIIKRITEERFADLKRLEIGVSVCASGYEVRARYVAEQLGKAPGRRIALGFAAHAEVGERLRNDGMYRNLGYQIEIVPGNSGDYVRRMVRETINSLKVCRILVDITSMTRYWYATFLDEMRQISDTEGRDISVYFTYVPSRYEKPPTEQPPNVSVGPVPGFSSIELPELPTAVILGLGHEPGKALGIAEYIDGRELYAFMTNPAFDKRFVRDVLMMNRQLVDRLSEGHLIEYPLPNITAMGLLLNSLAEGLLRTHRVILVPLGPKIFSLFCFLFALRHPEVSVWRVSSEEENTLAQRPPVGEVLVCRVDF